MTPLTWIESHIPDTEMWVEARTWRDYESQGFELVEFEPPPRWLTGCYSGRALIRKPNSACTHVWSPELAALHKHVCDTWDRNSCHRKPRVQKLLNAAHTQLFDDLRYHEELMRVERDAPLEVPQRRIVAAIRQLAEDNKGEANRRLSSIADDVERFRMTTRVQQGPPICFIAGIR